MGFCDIRNHQGRGKSYQPKPNAEAENTNQELDYLGYQKSESLNCVIINYFKKIRTNALSHRTVYFRQVMFLCKLDTALGNHALREQPTVYSLIC